VIIIFGLGNPGLEYKNTKHNIGWLILDKLADELGLSWQNSQSGMMIKYNAEVVLFKSSGYMNNSGKDLQKLISYYKIPAENLQLLVIQDDSDQNIGQAKLVNNGGSAGHRGILDIHKFLVSLNIELTQLWRLKIGIRPIGNKLKSETFVLTNIDSAENVQVTEFTKLLKEGLQKNNLSNLVELQQIINSKYVLKPANSTESK
jgi:PTH1 family peptidyl-tRNA hydrolase